MTDCTDAAEIDVCRVSTCAGPAWEEAERLAALDRYAILDTGREGAFDDVAELAADLLDAPIAVVNFIAADRQWFKAEKGIGKDSLPLDVSICRHAILQPGVFVVPDLTKDARFENNPLVDVADGLRFYAGALLETPDGLPLGTVCVLDTKVRPEGISPRQERALRVLAAQTMTQLELRRSNAAARHESDRLSAMFAQATVGISELGLDGRFLVVNDRLCEMLGRTRDELLTLRMADVTHPDDLANNLPLFNRMAETGASFSLDKRYVRPDGTIVWANSSVTRLLDESGRPRSALAVTSDITARREEEQHRTFQLELSDRTRDLGDPEAIVAATTRLLGERLGAARVLYADIHEAEGRATVRPDWTAPGVDHLPLSVGLADVGGAIVDHLRQGRTLCVNDVRTHPVTQASVGFLDKIGVAALVSVPLLKDGALVANLNVHRAEPHVWTPAELQLIETVAERTWEAMQRAITETALGESDARYRQIVEGAEDFAIVRVDEHGIIASWNRGAARITGFQEEDAIGRSGEIIFTPEDREAGAPDHEMNRARSDGRSVNERWHLRQDGSRFWGSGLTMRLDQPGGGYLKIFRDRTAEHEAEAQLRTRSEQLQGLAETAYAVARAPTLEATLDEITRAARRLVGTHQAVVSLTAGEDWAQVIPYVDLSDEYADWSDYRTPADGSGIYALVCETNRPMRMTQAEIEAHPCWQGFGAHAKDHPPMRGWLAVPLVGRDGRNLGLIQLSDKEDGSEFDENDEAVIVQLARIASAAIEQSAAEKALRESAAALSAEVEALSRLQEISTRLVVDEAPQALYDAILTAAAGLMGSECASLQMMDATGDLQLLAHLGYNPRSVEYWQTVDASSESTCGIALTTGQRVIVPDVENSGLAADSGDLQSYRWTGMRAVQTTPLLSRSGKPLGMLSTHWKRPHTPSERDFKLFDVLARQAADAIERTTAQAELRESEARQAFLLSLADALRSLRTPAEIASAAAEQLGERFGLSRVFYAELFGTLMKVQRDYTNGVASIVGEHDLRAFGPDLLRPYHECPIVKVDDVRTDPRFSEEARSGLQARQVGAYLDVVLFEEEKWVNLLALQSATPRTWTPSEEGLFRQVGERVKVAIERARAEDELRELNETLERRVAEALAEKKLLADLVEGTDAFVQVADSDFRWLAINRAAADEFEHIYGVRPKVGDSMLDLLADRPEHRTAIEAVWARALAGEQFTQVGEFGDPGLNRRSYEMKYNILRGANGEQIGAYQFVYDVTDRVAEQCRLAETEEALRQSQKMEAMGQLTGGVAHDFNNLLTPIVATLDRLQRKGIGGEREQRLIAGAAQSAERAKTLVQRLLAFARRQPLQPVPVDIAKLVHGMGDLVSSTTGPQIKVLVQAADNLPPAMADPNQLEMALLNLSVNARDAMPDKGTLRISASAETVGPGHRSKLPPRTYIRLSVADTGSGMDEATLARAVEPFFSTKGVGKGTGLGLSMVHGLASQLGGALTIQSRPGLGTNVELWLPESAARPEPVESAPAPAEVATRGTALLVDDEEFVRMSTADMLSDLGYTVIEAASAEEAMSLVTKGERFDLLVTDHLMPGMSGTDLARTIRKAKPGVVVLLVSGYAEIEGIEPGIPRLTKPFRKDELASSLIRLAPSA
ncbi:GAF domain-containing protein [Rubellimicrobium rubrum]|uniref:histidine kinase n=1 Tax=Rubellimicrobium rubrum TaxID=2585369 RepID=A0A5C4MSZ2_9RHOB|nr:GAF domain-containing protein [Rubellimicrobium rubrum]TNC48701.1 GAF domain-containing protein [Rubellimicrobium rubrum]